MQTKKLVIIGHRGARGLAPENTLLGFEKAIEHGVDMIEMDVRQTKDKQLVIVHKRVRGFTPYPGIRISDLTLAQLKEYLPDVPTLSETIEYIDRRVPLMIEIKKDVPPEPVVAMVKTYLKKGWQASDFMFNANRVRKLMVAYRELPEVDRIVQGDFSGLHAIYWARRVHTNYILLDQRYLWWGFVWLVSKRYKLITYTFPWVEFEPYNHHKASKWEKWGLYGVITDYPDYYDTREKIK